MALYQQIFIAPKGGISRLYTYRELGSKVRSKSRKGASLDTAEEKALDVMVRCLDTPPRKAPPAPPEEMARRAELARQYVIGRFKQHNEIEHDLACKIRLKRWALRMLPRETKWKEEALKFNNSGPPPWRLIPTDTPPNPNYNPDDWVSSDEE